MLCKSVVCFTLHYFVQLSGFQFGLLSDAGLRRGLNVLSPHEVGLRADPDPACPASDKSATPEQSQ